MLFTTETQVGNSANGVLDYNSVKKLDYKNMSLSSCEVCCLLVTRDNVHGL